VFNLSRFSGKGSALLILIPLLTQALPAAAQVTSLNMTSDPGDYVGQGQTYYVTTSDSFFTTAGNQNGGVSIYLYGVSGHNWSMDFAAPNNAQLVPGSYLNATVFPYEAAGVPGFDVFGLGHGCSVLTGSFTVLQVAYNGPNNWPSAFDATFEQHCEGAAAALRGEIRYNATPALYLTASPDEQTPQNENLTFQVTAVDAQSRHVVLSASELPTGATFTDLGNNTGSFSWTPSSSQPGTYAVTFSGDNQQGDQTTLYLPITVTPPAPVNDDFASAVVFSSIPSTYSEDATYATAAPDDPWCYGNAQSVWFAYTPQTNIRLEANTFGSGYDNSLSVYTGSRGALTQIGCNDDAGGTLQARVRFDATAGTTYYFMVASPNLPLLTSANLVFNLLQAPPPFTFTPSLYQFGTVSASTGAVTLQGSVSCSEPAYVTLYGGLKQTRGGTPIDGYWNAFVPCNGVTPWTATVQSQTVLFHGRSALLFSGGQANVAATAYAFDPDTGEQKVVNLTTTVTLRGAN
jgi:hypothetical protein